LVFMLVLTQMSVGAFVMDLVLEGVADARLMLVTRPIRVIAALLVGLVGINAAVFHLGRPLYAFRAWIGLGKSWLSREILAFGLFAFFAAAYAAEVWLGHRGLVPDSGGALRLAAAVSGLLGVFCSVMIYVDTRRPFWSLPLTGAKFLFTGLVLGIPITLLVAVLAAAAFDALTVPEVMAGFGRILLGWLGAAVATKLGIELMVLAHLRDKKYTLLKRTALLLTGELRSVLLGRVVLGVAGGILVPVTLIAEQTVVGAGGFHPIAGSVLVGVSLVLTLAGEVMERYLFFTAAVAPKMPGGYAP